MTSKKFKSSSPCPLLTESIVHDMIESAEKIIDRCSYSTNSDYCTTSSLFTANTSREEADAFISAVYNLQAAISFLSSTNSSSKSLIRSQKLIRNAMKWLTREFCRILASEVNTTDLKTIAECMMDCGYSKECTKIFRSVRKSIVDEALQRLGIDPLSLNLQFQKIKWEEIEDVIRNWLSSTKIAMETIFSYERSLCDLVFLSSSTINNSCFSAIARENALSIFGFPEQVASKCKKSPEKLFRFLDLYEAIQELRPEIDYIFSSDSSSSVKSQAETSLIKLAEAARTTLQEFESAIQKDSSKKPVTGGGIHPLTRYVMNYLTLMSDYTSVLEQILVAWPLNLQAPLPEEYTVNNNSNLSLRFIWLTLVLLSTLDRKSDLHKQVSLSYLFLSNNLHYIVKKVHTSDLSLILGEAWIANHSEKARQYASSYERIGWSKVLDSLSDSNPTGEERFRRFNAAFVEVQGRHVEWVVEDRKMREEMKESLVRKIVPKYREMYEIWRERLVRGKRGESIVRYAPEDLENYLRGILFGCSDGGSSRSRGSTTSSCCSSPMVLYV